MKLKMDEQAKTALSPNLHTLSPPSRDDAIVTVRNGAILTADNLGRLFGFRDEDVTAMAVLDFVAPRHRPSVTNALETASQGNCEIEGVRKDGSFFPLRMGFHWLTDIDTGLCVVTFRDLTVTKSMEQEVGIVRQQVGEMTTRLREIERSEEYYKSIYENAMEGIFRADANGRLVAANPALARMHGCDNVQELLESAARLGNIYTRPKEVKNISKLLREEGVARDVEAEIYKKDGNTRWVRMNVRAQKDEKGRILYYEGTLQDITDKKWAEDKYQSIFMNATEGIFQITPEGRLLAANPALTRIHGFNSLDEFMENATDISTQLHVDIETWYEYLEAMKMKGFVRDQLWKMYRKDGSVAWLSCNARVIRDESGHVLYHEGTIQDITDRKIMFDQILMQRDLALRLAQTGAIGEGLALILVTAVKASGMESGGIWLKREGENLELISSIGFSAKFEKKSRVIGRVGSREWKRMMSDKTMLTVPTQESMPNVYEEGYKYAAIIPILHEDRVIASFNLFSRIRESISEQALIGLDFLAGQLGSIIMRIDDQQQVEQEIKTRREAEKALQVERHSLEEANIALKVLLGQREKDKEELEQRLVSNVNELVLPHVEKLKKTHLEGMQRATLTLVENNLKEILSPFRQNIRNFNLTPRQMEIVALIRQGRSTKEIAEAINATKDAIDKQRFIIRRKLGLNKEKENLRSFLLSV